MFWKNFFELCQSQNKSPNSVAADIGLSSGSVSAWKSGRVPKFATLKKVADYFSVSVDYLLAEDPPARSRDEPSNAIFLEQQNIHMIPLYESVSAGFGALAINDVIDYVPIYMTSPIEAAETLCIKVTGDSMYPKIEDGDIIQVHKQDSVDSGSIAVVLLDNDDGLVKKVIYGETWIELHSINPMYKTMRFNGSDVLRVKVLGKVNKIIKNV